MMSTLSYRGHEALSNSNEYFLKPEKPWFIIRPVDYLLREQRLFFISIGIAIASMFFILQPGFFASNVDENAGFMHNQQHRVIYENPLSQVSQYHSGMMVNSGDKVPLGLKRKSLLVAVTGGSSFVGSHLVDRLMARGDTVIVVDNFFTGRKENVLHHFGNPRFELIRHNVVEPLLLEVDQIYHLACPASPVHYKHNPVKTIKTNVVGTLNMLGLAKRVGARFLLTSTSEVYGDPLEHPQIEAYWGVRSCYDEGKRTVHRGANVEVLIVVILGLKFGTAGDAGLTKGYSSFMVFLFCAYALGFGWSWGPLNWLIPSEIFPLEIQSTGKSINVGVNLLVTFILAQVFLSMLCHMRYGIFLFYASWVIIMTIFVYFLLPKTKNIPIEEMT